MRRNRRADNAPWPGGRESQKATAGGRNGLHVQSVRQIVCAFDAAVETTGRNCRAGRRDTRYPYKDRRHFPRMWPIQAMGWEERQTLLPMGQGGSSLILPRPA